MKIVANITKDTVQNYIPFFCSGVHTDKSLFSIFKSTHSGFTVAVNAVNSMYYFIQVMHVVVYLAVNI